jgi:hypothetical protein
VNDGSVNALARVDLGYIDARARATKAAPLQACSAYLVTRMLPNPRASLSGGMCMSHSDALQQVVEGSLVVLGVCLRVAGFIEGIL